jgi:Spy/CpxP family protein refolding chaperone
MKCNAIAASMALALGLLLTQPLVHAAPSEAPPAMHRMAPDAPMDHGWMGGPDHDDPKEQAKHIAHRVERMLAGTDVSAEQKAKIVAIHQAAMADMAPLHTNGRDLHKRMGDLLSAPAIDRAAIEAVRLQLQQIHETASRRMTQARIDSSEVLSPAQRTKVAALMRERADKMREHAKHMREHMEHMKDDPHHHMPGGPDMSAPLVPPASPRS